jgi:hypothetical protein
MTVETSSSNNALTSHKSQDIEYRPFERVEYRGRHQLFFFFSITRFNFCGATKVRQWRFVSFSLTDHHNFPLNYEYARTIVDPSIFL